MCSPGRRKADNRNRQKWVEYSHSRWLVAPQALNGAWIRRFRDSVLQGTGLGSPSAQLALEIAFSERHTPRAQDVVCGDGVEIEVGQRERKDEGLRREG
jgi:hypothetical protein